MLTGWPIGVLNGGAAERLGHEMSHLPAVLRIRKPGLLIGSAFGLDFNYSARTRHGHSGNMWHPSWTLMAMLLCGNNNVIIVKLSLHFQMNLKPKAGQVPKGRAAPVLRWA